MTIKSLLSYMQPTQVKNLEEREARKPVVILPSFGKARTVEDLHLLFAYTYSSAQEQTRL